MTNDKRREFVRVDYEPRNAYFAVRVHNNDMINAHIPQESVVILHKQQTAEDGDIILALHNDKQVFRYYRKSGDQIYLIPANNSLLPVAIVNTDTLDILGKAVEIRVEL